MATIKEISVEDKLRALYALQLVDSKIDEIRNVRGELPLEVEDLEDEVAGLSTRLEKLKSDLETIDDQIKEKKNAIDEHKTAIKKYGTSKEYFIENIDKISLAFPEKNSFQAAWENSPWIRGGERLTFDYKGKSIRFGRKLDEKDAKLLFQLITKRIEEQLKKKNKN